MRRFLNRLCLLSAALMVVTAAQAQDVEQRVRDQLRLLQPDLVVEQVSPVEGSGLYQVQLKGGQFLYINDTV